MAKETNGAAGRIFSTILICITVVAVAYFYSERDTYIQNTAPSTPVGSTLSNTISVSGDGKALAVPDMVRLSISASEVATTTKAAQNQVDAKIAQVLQILQQNNIPNEDIQTTEISLYPEYDYTAGYNRVRGQRATQRLNISIKKIDPKAEKVARIIDAVSEIDRIQMDSIQFDIDDKTALYTKARELAYNKAEQKAVELAKLGNVELLKPVSIQDAVVDFYPQPIPYANVALDRAQGAGGGGQISTGQMEVSVQIQVMFGIR